MVELSTAASWGAIIAAFTGLLLLGITLIDRGVVILKHYISPNWTMDVNFSFPNQPDIYPDEIVERMDDKLVVKPGKVIKFDVTVVSNLLYYTPTQVDFRSESGFEIRESRLFVKERRWWEEPYPGPDIFGDFKIHTPGLILIPKGISGEGTYFGFEIHPPLVTGETRHFTFRMDVKESRKPLEKEFIIEAVSDSG